MQNWSLCRRLQSHVNGIPEASVVTHTTLIRVSKCLLKLDLMGDEGCLRLIV